MNCIRFLSRWCGLAGREHTRSLLQNCAHQMSLPIHLSTTNNVQANTVCNNARFSCHVHEIGVFQYVRKENHLIWAQRELNACEPCGPRTCCWSRSPICSTCLSRPQDSFYALLRKRAMLQAHQQRLLSLCSHCAGTRELAQVTLLPFRLRVRSLSCGLSRFFNRFYSFSTLSRPIYQSFCPLSSVSHCFIFWCAYSPFLLLSLSMSRAFSISFSLVVSLFLSLSLVGFF